MRNRKAICHNELDQLDYTYRSAMDDLQLALEAAQPRFEGNGNQRRNTRYR